MFRVTGLHQRRLAYLQRIEAELYSAINQRSERMLRSEQERYERIRMSVFESCEECIEWVEQRIVRVHTVFVCLTHMFTALPVRHAIP
jgi:hypothetical protein